MASVAPVASALQLPFYYKSANGSSTLSALYRAVFSPQHAKLKDPKEVIHRHILMYY